MQQGTVVHVRWGVFGEGAAEGFCYKGFLENSIRYGSGFIAFELYSRDLAFVQQCILLFGIRENRSGIAVEVERCSFGCWAFCHVNLFFGLFCLFKMFSLQPVMMILD